MTGLRKRPKFVIALTALLVFVLFLSFIQVQRHAQFNALRYWAGKIEQGQPVSPAIIAAFTPVVTALIETGECQERFLKAGLTLALLDVDDADPDVYYESWSASLQRAERLARHALSCLPTDGNIWLRLAMLRQAIAEQPGDIARFVTLSQLYSPAEEAVVVGRYLLYTKLTHGTLELLNEAFRQDLQIICSPEFGHRRRELLPASGPRVMDMILRTVPNCPPIGK